VPDEHKGQSSSAGHPGELDDAIVAALPEMSKKQREIARFILDNPDTVAFASAGDVGTRTQSSAATVVRFCQALGYEGYVELQATIRERMRLRRTMVQRLEERLADPIPQDDLLARVFAADIRNIERLAELTDSDRLQAAAAEIRRARQILVVGGGLTATVAGFFTHALRVIGLQARSVVGGGEPLALALAFLRPEDVVIGISFWRNLRDVVQAIQEAQDAGATTIGITDSKLSPLARWPDYSFLVATDGVAHSLSPVATLSLLNAFVAALSSDMPAQVVESLQLVDRAYRRSGLLAE
jgi:DNA-binding MurR/RpiR family transcriptional regulator